MNIRTFKFLLSAFLLMAFPSTVSAQFIVDIGKPEVTKILEPNFGTDLTNKTFRQKDWMEAEIQFKIQAKDRKKLFADRISIKWYIAVKDPKNKGDFLLLEREVNHVNVPLNEEIYASVYLSPSSILRITGGDRVNKGDYEEIGGVMTIEGQEPAGTKKGFFSLNTQKVWWNSGKLSRTDKIPLLNKDETPFKTLWFSRYAELEEEK